MPRSISIDSIRDAARTVYGAAVDALRSSRSGRISAGGPEIFLKLETLQPIGSFKIRGAYNAVSRLTPEALAAGVWTVSAGNAAQGVALAARTVGRALQRAGHGHGAGDQAARHRAPRRDDRESVVRRVLEDGRRASLAAHDRPLRPPVRRRRFHQRQRDGGPRNRRGPAGRRRGGRADRRRRTARRASLSRCARCDRRRVVYAAEPETAAPLARSLQAGKASRFDEWKAVVRRRRRRQIGRLDDVAAVAGTRRAILSSSRSTKRADAMRIVAERLHVIAEGAAACAVAAALSPEMAARGHRRVVAVVSGGNVDLSTFAQLVGACAS